MYKLTEIVKCTVLYITEVNECSASYMFIQSSVHGEPIYLSLSVVIRQLLFFKRYFADNKLIGAASF